MLAAALLTLAPAAQELIVPEGLEATVWARSPQLFNPTCIDVDARGRIWVAEGANYRRFNDGGQPRRLHEGGDRIVVLEDTDGDGRCDASKVFAQDPELVAPLGLAVLGSRVFVSCSPSLFVYVDENGDDRAERREVFLTGFGGHDHDHALHSLVGGPDGRCYLNAGNAGPHVVADQAGWTLRAGSFYTGGSPHNGHNEPGLRSDDGRVWVGGVALRIAPDGKGMTVIGHNFRNAYELCVDSFGNVWQNDNDDTIGCRTTWLMERGNLGFASADGKRSWQAGQRPGQPIPAAHWRQDDPGVIPAGDVYGAGAPTGIAFYEGGALGAAWAGTLLSCEAGRNVVWAYRVAPDGAGFRLARSRFATSVERDDPGYEWHVVPDDRRNWFRPSDVAVGADGAVYVADWIDPIVGGHQMREREGEGAIYRIARKGAKVATPHVDVATIEALRSPAVHVRWQSFTALAARGEVAPVRALLDDPDRFVRARAIWLLARLGDEGRAAMQTMLAAPEPELRITALRALRAVGRDVAARLIDDPSPAVRREVALALREVPFERCREQLVALAQRCDGEDRWYLEALGTACEGRESEAYDLLHARLGDADPLRWSAAFAAIAWRLHPPQAVAALRARAASELPRAARVAALTALAFVPGDAAAPAVAALAEQGPMDIRELAVWWLRNPEQAQWRAHPECARVLAALDEPSAEVAKPAAPMPAGPLPPRPELLAMAGDAARGEALFFADRAACAVCHRAGERGGEIGPDLSQIARTLDRSTMLEALLEPSAKIATGYETLLVETAGGELVAGLLLEDGDPLVLRDAAGTRHAIATRDVAFRRRSETSLMPLTAAGLCAQEIADLLAFLGTRR
jgi:putative membrane-bound dehydrogenase-like protein